MWIFSLHVNDKYLFVSTGLPVFQVCDEIAETFDRPGKLPQTNKHFPPFSPEQRNQDDDKQN
jgi:hypothetical protein